MAYSLTSALSVMCCQTYCKLPICNVNSAATVLSNYNSSTTWLMLHLSNFIMVVVHIWPYNTSELLLLLTMVCTKQQKNNSFGKCTPGHQLSLYFVYFKIHFFLGGKYNGDNIIFLHLDFRSFGYQPMCIQSFEKQQGWRAYVFVVDFIVDFTKLMTTSSQLPPTQRHTQNLHWCIFYHFLEIQYCTRLTEQREVAGFHSAFSHVPKVIYCGVLFLNAAICILPSE